MTEPEHGTVQRYQSKRLKCRCDLCRAANTAKAAKARANPPALKPPVTDVWVAELRDMGPDALTAYCDKLLHEEEPRHQLVVQPDELPADGEA